jgi:putative membrane protein
MFELPLMELAVHLVLTAALLLLVARLVTGLEIDSWGAAFIVALLLGLINAIVRPIMVALTIPISVLTLGLFLLVINALMLWLAAAISPGVKVEGFGAAFFGALLLTVLNILIAFVFGVSLMTAA